MIIYYFDALNRYIGSRILVDGETMPLNATTIPVLVTDGEEAFFNNSTWYVQKIVEQEMPIDINVIPTIDERVDAVETDVDDIITVLAVIEGVA